MIKFYMYNKKTLAVLPEEIFTFLKSKIYYRATGYKYTTAFINGTWDGKVSMVTEVKEGHAFPTGLAGKVSSALKKEGFNLFKFVDKRIKPEGKPYGWTGKKTLRDYQDAAIDKALKATRGVLYIATGGGKTLIASRVIQQLGLKSLFLVNTKEALHQTIVSIEEVLGYKPGVYGAGKKDIRSITVATVAAVFMNRKKLKSYFKELDCLIIDECHHAAANSWYQVAMSIPAYFRFGITGSALRTDGKDLKLWASTGKVIFQLKADKLADKGFLMKPKVTFKDISMAPIYGAQYKDEYYHGIVVNEKRNNEIVKLALEHKDKSTLIMVEAIEHGQILEKLLYYMNAVFVSGSSKNRVEVLEDFRKGRIKTLIATRIYNESVDIPCLEVVILASAGKSPVKTIQQIGRALRLSLGKEEVLIFDFMDSFGRRLRKHSERRIATCKKEGFKVVLDTRDVSEFVS